MSAGNTRANKFYVQLGMLTQHVLGHVPLDDNVVVAVQNICNF